MAAAAPKLSDQEINNLQAHNAKLVESEMQVIKERDEARALVQEFTEQNAILY